MVYFDLNSKEFIVRNIDKQIQGSKSNIASLQNKLNDLMPDKPYILINTAENRFVLRNSKDTIRTGVCSTGKDEILIYPNGMENLSKHPKVCFLFVKKDLFGLNPTGLLLKRGKASFSTLS